MSDLKQKFEKGLNALALELPEAVYTDFSAICHSYIQELETEISKLTVKSEV